MIGQDQLEVGFTGDEKAGKSKRSGLSRGRLEMGGDPMVWQKIQAVLDE